MNLRRITGAAMILSLIAGQAHAAIRPYQYIADPVDGRDDTTSIDLLSVQQVESLRTFDSEDVAFFIPSNMSPSTDGNRVAGKILGHSLENFSKDENVKKSKVGRTAQRIDTGAQKSVKFGGDESGNHQQSVQFRMRTFQAKAQVDYEGPLNAQVSYQITEDKFLFEIYHKVSESTRVAVNHEIKRGEAIEGLSLQWEF
jgi:hypothetical protein